MARAPLQHLSTQDRHAIQTELESSVRLFAPAKSAQLIASCARALALLGAPGGPADSPAGSSPPAGPLAAYASAALAGRAAPAAPAAPTGSLAMGGDKRLAIDSE